MDLSKRKPFMNKDPVPAPSTASTSLDEAAKKSLATSFMQSSGMNLQMSVECLENNGWDFDKAAQMFKELKDAGRIPASAFQH